VGELHLPLQWLREAGAVDRQAFELRALAGTRGAGAPLRNRSGATSAIVLSLNLPAGAAADAAAAAASPGATRGQQGLPESPPAPAGATGLDGAARVAEAAREMEVRPPPPATLWGCGTGRCGAVVRDAVGRGAGRRDNTSLIDKAIEEVLSGASTSVDARAVSALREGTGPRRAAPHRARLSPGRPPSARRRGASARRRVGRRRRGGGSATRHVAARRRQQWRRRRRQARPPSRFRKG
jgi:hypothetical protein